LVQVQKYLELLEIPEGMAKGEVRKFLKKSS